MIMIWSGWGIQVPVYVVVAFFLAMFGLSPLHLAEGMTAAASLALTGAIAGGAIYFTARSIESKPGRKLIDAATNQAFEVRPSAGSFFFIPTRFWAFLAPLLCFLAAGYSVMNPTAFHVDPAGAAAPLSPDAPTSRVG